MYTLTRSEAAQYINVSTRSIDRYIKAGKIRTKKEGKIIYLHKEDIKNIGNLGHKQEQEVIMPHEKKTYPSNNAQETIQETSLHNNDSSHLALEKIYFDLKHEIKEKDKMIQNLSLRLGQAQEIAKNSVSVIEFKKSQYLLEESKTTIIQEVQKLSEEKNTLKKKLEHEKTTNIVLISFCIILMLSLGTLWFLSI